MTRRRHGLSHVDPRSSQGLFFPRRIAACDSPPALNFDSPVSKATRTIVPPANAMGIMFRSGTVETPSYSTTALLAEISSYQAMTSFDSISK